MIRQPEDLVREGLESFCETIVGDLISDTGDRSILDLVESVQRRIVLLDVGIRRKVNRFLRRLATPGGLIRNGAGLKRFSRLTLVRREKILGKILDSSRSRWCGIAQSLYRQTVFAASQDSSAAVSTGPPDPSTDRPAEHSLFEVSHVRASQSELACDWLVIGSGPAGSVMAAELAETGQSVLLIEQGSLLSDGSRLSEAETSRRLIETHHAWTDQPEAVLISAGRAFGGGSIVNWGTCLDPPDRVLGNWSEATNYDFQGGDVFRHSLFAVRRRLMVAEPSAKNQANRNLENAARRLGLNVRPTESSTDECPDCQACQFGCSTGKKKDMRSTWLVDASRLGVFLLPDCRVNRLVLDHGKAKSAVARIAGPGAESREVQISFRNCVLAAGAIHSPSILLRSGFSSPHLGRHLFVHPSVIVPAVFPEPLLWQGGPIQSCVVDIADQNPRGGPQVILENSFFPRGLAMMSLPWRSSREFSAMARSLDCWAGTLVLCGDRSGGTVAIDEKGRPIIRYRLGAAERMGLRNGVLLAKKIMLEAGALAAYGAGWKFAGAGPGRSPESASAAGGMQRLWSAHQMGTCRMSDSPQRGVVDSSGQVFGLGNVFVCDSSVFPSAPGVNPLVTVCATAHFLAQQIKRRVC